MIKDVNTTIHLFIQYLMSIYYMPGTIQGTGYTTVNKAKDKPYLPRVPF